MIFYDDYVYLFETIFQFSAQDNKANGLSTRQYLCYMPLRSKAIEAMNTSKIPTKSFPQ